MECQLKSRGAGSRAVFLDISRRSQFDRGEVGLKFQALVQALSLSPVSTCLAKLRAESIQGEPVQAKDYPLNVVLQERQQWVIPVYQRTYAWDTRPDKQLPKLWDDLRDRALERLDGLHPKPHFVGAIIYAQPNDQPFGTVNKRFLVDGQQRITTFSLALCALRECARDAGVDRLIATIDDYVFNAQSASMAEPEREKFKLWSSSFDRPLYTAIATRTADEVRAAFPDYFYKNGNIVLGQAPKVLAAYWFLKDEITAFIAETPRSSPKRGKRTYQPKRRSMPFFRGSLAGFRLLWCNSARKTTRKRSSLRSTAMLNL